MSFRSILFEGAVPDVAAVPSPPPDDVVDLHLDDIVGFVTTMRDAYDLAPFFHHPLADVASVAYRQEVFRDLEEPAAMEAVRQFAVLMRRVREHLGHAEKVRYQHERGSWFLEAAESYCRAVEELARDLQPLELGARGLLVFREALERYAASSEFGALRDDAQRVAAGLGGITYRLHISYNRVTVSLFADEPDYGAEVLETFAKFKQQEARDYAFDGGPRGDLNHVEIEVLDRVARLHPEPFAALGDFVERHRAFLDATIVRFDREVQFYVAYLEHVARFRSAGLPFCYPVVTAGDKEVRAIDTFDLALADRLVATGTPVVLNDVLLEGSERILVVSGPNQGGKTTFARMIGQLHHLARLGCPVPGREVRLHLVDRIFTHFERAEDIESLTGKLEDDLRRVREILAEMTPDSLLVMNESFNSTTVEDALVLNREVLRAAIERDAVCVVVTFLDELSTLGPTTVSVVGVVDPADPARRTFRLERRPADGLAYAMAIAEKHRLTYGAVRERIPG